MNKCAALLLPLLLASRVLAGAPDSPPAVPASAGAFLLPDATETPRMKKWMDYHYGLFIHFNINTFVGTEQVPHPPPAATYAPPPSLDVDAWVQLAKDAGMKYAVLTTKHSGGFCLWDSKAPWHGKEFDYDVAASGNKTDVVRAFVDACQKHGIAPGFYYCLADSYANKSAPIPQIFRKGLLPDDAFELAKAQLAELATNYPGCHYFWLDTPKTATVGQQAVLYDLLRRKNPENVVLMNHHLASGAAAGDQTLVERGKDVAYPVDVLNTESRQRPHGVVSKTQRLQERTFCMGYEHCDMAGAGWFNTKKPKSVDALFALYQSIRQDGGNFLPDIGPSRAGAIAPVYRQTLVQPKAKIDAWEETSAEAKQKP